MKTANQLNLDTVAKFHRLLVKEGVEPDHINAPNNNVAKRQNLAEYLKNGCPKVSNNGEVAPNQLPEGHELARFILGDDYITPEEVATAYGVSYTDEQLEHFADTMPDMQTILWLHIDGYILIAGPSVEMNLLQIRDLDRKLFYSKTEGWYTGNNQKFSTDDTVKAGQWLAIRKETMPNLFNKTRNEQHDLITEVEYVPNATEVSYAIIAYFKVRGVYLLRLEYVRTSSITISNFHVEVGDFNEKGLIVCDCWDSCDGPDLGIASARKLTSSI